MSMVYVWGKTDVKNYPVTACHIVCKWLSLKQWRTHVAFYSSYNHKVGLMTLQANKNQVTAQQDISLDV